MLVRSGGGERSKALTPMPLRGAREACARTPHDVDDRASARTPDSPKKGKPAVSHTPLDALMQRAGDRAAAAKQLDVAHRTLLEAIETYRAAWKAATDAGWAATDLQRAGLLKPGRLPRHRLTRTAPDIADNVENQD